MTPKRKLKQISIYDENSMDNVYQSSNKRNKPKIWEWIGR